MSIPPTHAEIRYRPSFAALCVRLAPGQRIVAEAGAMASMPRSVSLRPQFFGGFVPALLRRLCLSESLLVNEFSIEERPEQTAPSGLGPHQRSLLPLPNFRPEAPPAAAAELVLSRSMPGDLCAVCLQPATVPATVPATAPSGALRTSSVSRPVLPPEPGSLPSRAAAPAISDAATLPEVCETLYLQPGAFVACEPGVRLGLAYAGLRSWLGRAGLLRLRASGRGQLWFGSYGAIEARQVGSDEEDGELIVDTGHLVAHTAGLRVSLRLSSGLLASVLSGEGLVTRFRGRGVVYVQTRSLSRFAAWINRSLA